MIVPSQFPADPLPPGVVEPMLPGFRKPPDWLACAPEPIEVVDYRVREVCAPVSPDDSGVRDRALCPDKATGARVLDVLRRAYPERVYGLVEFVATTTFTERLLM